jgi:hypothetical protein
MPRFRLLAIGLVLAALLTGATVATAATGTGSATAPRGPRVGGCAVFPANNWWNRDISRLPVDGRSATWLSYMSTDRNLHPDFGPSYGDGPDYGIPITVVRKKHRRVPVSFTYASESYRGRYPFGKDTKIEGGRNSGGDMHAVVVVRRTCRLFETWNTRVLRGPRWTAGSGATWSLKSNALRPDGWTSADAAGLPILPGLLRWPEVKYGAVRHAIRFTTDITSSHHLWPARHDAGSTSSWAYPPMGARFRLKASYPLTGYGYARRVLTAMKHYGLVLADNGSPWFFQGERNAHWPPALVEALKRIPASAFEAVDTSSLQVKANSAATR